MKPSLSLSAWRKSLLHTSSLSVAIAITFFILVLFLFLLKIHGFCHHFFQYCVYNTCESHHFFNAFVHFVWWWILFVCWIPMDFIQEQAVNTRMLFLFPNILISRFTCPLLFSNLPLSHKRLSPFKLLEILKCFFSLKFLCHVSLVPSYSQTSLSINIPLSSFTSFTLLALSTKNQQ